MAKLQAPGEAAGRTLGHEFTATRVLALAGPSLIDPGRGLAYAA
jgi:hypothetical protein